MFAHQNKSGSFRRNACFQGSPCRDIAPATAEAFSRRWIIATDHTLHLTTIGIRCPQENGSPSLLALHRPRWKASMSARFGLILHGDPVSESYERGDETSGLPDIGCCHKCHPRYCFTGANQQLDRTIRRQVGESTSLG